MPKKKERFDGVSNESLEQFKDAFANYCAASGIETVRVTYAGLAEMTGLSEGTVYKVIRELSRTGFLEVSKSSSRRFPHTYKLLQPIVPSESYDYKGKDFIGSYQKLRRELDEMAESNKELQKEVTILKAIVGELDVISETDLPGNLKQITYKSPENDE